MHVITRKYNSQYILFIVDHVVMAVSNQRKILIGIVVLFTLCISLMPFYLDFTVELRSPIVIHPEKHILPMLVNKEPSEVRVFCIFCKCLLSQQRMKPELPTLTSPEPITPLLTGSDSKKGIQFLASHDVASFHYDIPRPTETLSELHSPPSIPKASIPATNLPNTCNRSDIQGFCILCFTLIMNQTILNLPSEYPFWFKMFASMCNISFNYLSI